MKKALLLVIFSVFAFTQVALSSLSRHVVDYQIRARLMPEEKAVSGEEILTWLNDSEQPVSELQFHLYLNAFKNNRSSFLRESGGDHRGFKADEKNWGYVEVRKIQVANGFDLTPSLEYIQPDDDNSDDRTVMKVSLPEPVPPKGKVTLLIEFYSKLPKVFARSGFYGNFFMVAQWFPKIGVFWEGEWNCHQYHLNSEFFADFGVYRVEVTVPEDYVVGATGKRIDRKENGDGTVTYTHFQEDVHDFAWTACPDFVEFKEKYVTDDPPVDTEMILLVHRSHIRHKDRYLNALKNGIEFYSQSYGPYPYPTITLVDPAPGALAAGGMEYPTLFTAGTMSWLPGGIFLPEMVTIHEFGHNYWYGMVASNEFEEAWLDEGINTYSEIKLMDKYYGADSSMFNIHGLKISDLALQRAQVVAWGQFDPILRNSWEFVSRGSYGMNVYSKAGIVLLTLEKYLGEEVMSDVMRTYFERWKFGHPTSRDFIAVAEEVSGQELGWFFDQFLRSPGKLDYAVSSMSSKEVDEPEGVFEGEKKIESGGKAEKTYRNEVVIQRKEEFVFPQEIVIVFEDGEEVRERWDGKDRWKKFVYYGTSKLKSAQLDPEGKMILDANTINNSQTLKPRKTPIMKHALRLMSHFQHLLSFISQ